MTFTNLLMGLTIGFPIMVVAGPISILLLDQGLERGTRTAAPAVLGVASADLTFAVIASLAGATAAMLLEPVAGWLTLIAVAVLLWLAGGLARSAFTELRSASWVSDTIWSADASPALVGVGPSEWRSAPPAGEHLGPEHVSAVDPATIGETTSVFGSLRGTRLAAAFYGLTMVNPLTIVLFSSVVIAGGPGVGSAGWALGMALASFVAHGAYVLVGGVLGTRLSARATASLRAVAAVFMAGLAAHFLMG